MGGDSTTSRLARMPSPRRAHVVVGVGIVLAIILVAVLALGAIGAAASSTSAKQAAATAYSASRASLIVALNDLHKSYDAAKSTHRTMCAEAAGDDKDCEALEEKIDAAHKAKVLNPIPTKLDSNRTAPQGIANAADSLEKRASTVKHATRALERAEGKVLQNHEGPGR